MESCKRTLKAMIEIRDEEIRAWLLHGLDEPRSDVLERQLFTDAVLAERIDATLNDLLDDCAQGRLSGNDEVVLRARARARLGFARALAEMQPLAAARPLERRRPRRALWIALAASVALVAIATSLRWSLPQQQVDMDGGEMPVVSLLADQRRSAGTVFAMPHHDGDVRLEVEIPRSVPQVSSYRLTVTDGSHALFEARGLAPRSAGPYRFVETVVPARSLGPSPRTISLTADDASGAPQPMEWAVQMAPH